MLRKLVLLCLCLHITIHAIEQRQPDKFRKRVQIQQLQDEKKQLLRAVGTSNVSAAYRKTIGLDKLLANLGATNARQASLNALSLRTKISRLEKRNNQLEQALAHLEGQTKQLNNTLQTIAQAKNNPGKSINLEDDKH